MTSNVSLDRSAPRERSFPPPTSFSSCGGHSGEVTTAVLGTRYGFFHLFCDPFPPHWKTKAEAAESGITEIRGFQLYRQNEEFCLFFVNECHVYFSVLFCICYLWERDGRLMALVNLFDSFTVRRFLTVFWWPWLEIPKGKQPKLTELIILIRIFFSN